MKTRIYLLWLSACFSMTSAWGEEAETPAAPKPAGGHVFAWPFLEREEMQPRGGTTQGSEVTLMKGKRPAWERLQQDGISKQEKDRRAILAMAGNYRVSFDFTEVLGLAEDFKPTRPYFSWGTENVSVIEEREDFVSLQHSLVMYFKNEKGETEGPHVMKHWRQDWTREDQEMLSYVGDRKWKKIATPEPAGRWTQAVFQVDDSPRYEVAGEWSHDGGLSTWRSDNCPRPLPRREFSVRKDYNVLEGVHEISITPNGWVHLQNNNKMRVEEGRSRVCIGKEIGVDRYEEITEPELAPAFDAYWAKTGSYWKDVRDVWAEVFAGSESLSMAETQDGQQLFMIHFAHAAKLEEGEEISAEENRKHAEATIRGFVLE